MMLIESLHDVLHLNHKILMKILDVSLDFLVLGDKLIPMFETFFGILADFFLLGVVHMEFPHLETLVVELKISLDLFANSFLSSGLFFNIGFVFWVFEELSVLL